MKRPVFALAACLVAGCGSEAERTVAPDRVVAAAAAHAMSHDSARVAMTVSLTVDGHRYEVRSRGIVGFRPVRSRLRHVITAGERHVRQEQIGVGRTVYVKSGRRWTKLDVGRTAALPGPDPSRYLQLLRAVGHVESLGPATVAGRATTHYRARVDYRKMAATGPRSLRALARATVRSADSPVLPVDVWIDGGGLLRRERTSGRDPATIDLLRYDVDTATIAAPPARETVDGSKPRLTYGGF